MLAHPELDIRSRAGWAEQGSPSGSCVAPDPLAQNVGSASDMLSWYRCCYDVQGAALRASSSCRSKGVPVRKSASAALSDRCFELGAWQTVPVDDDRQRISRVVELPGHCDDRLQPLRLSRWTPCRRRSGCRRRNAQPRRTVRARPMRPSAPDDPRACRSRPRRSCGTRNSRREPWLPTPTCRVRCSTDRRSAHRSGHEMPPKLTSRLPRSRRIGRLLRIRTRRTCRRAPR